jgi:hypothetical protein
LIKLIKESIEATNERAQMNKSAAAAALMVNNPLDIYNQTSVLINRYQPILQQQQLQQQQQQQWPQQQSFYQPAENKCIFFFVGI